MDASEIHEHKIDGAVSVFFFARAYGDDRSSAAAYERARAKISGKDNTSLFRVRAWGGLEYSPTPDEIAAIASRFRVVAEAGALNSAASWGGVGGLGLGSEGSRGPMRRPQG